MNQPGDRLPDAPARKQTPRVPSNFLYARLVPMAIGVLVLLLLAPGVLACVLRLFASTSHLLADGGNTRPDLIFGLYGE